MYRVSYSRSLLSLNWTDVPNLFDNFKEMITEVKRLRKEGYEVLWENLDETEGEEE